MKIAFIVGKFPVLSEAFILNQITGLIERGHEVDIYALEGASNETKVHPLVQEFQLLKRTFYCPHLPKNSLLRILKGIGLILKNFRRNPLVCFRTLNIFKYGQIALSMRLLYRSIPFLESPSYDIIHAQFGNYALQTLLILDIQALRGKLVTSFRGFDISWMLKKYGKNVYNDLFKKGDFFLTNCDFFNQRLLTLGCNPNRLLVHRSGINCNQFTLTVREIPVDRIIRIVTVGRLVEKKGIEYSIKAVAEVLKIYPNLQYNIIGDGKLKPQLEELIINLNADHKIQLLGWQTQTELVYTLKNAQIFIAPSISAADGNQDAPVNTLKEAMAMGLPVIGTQHGGIPELIEDGVSGFLVPEKDTSAIAEKLIFLIEHPEIWAQMGQAGRIYVEKYYDMNKLNDQLVEIYQTVCQTP